MAEGKEEVRDSAGLVVDFDFKQPFVIFFKSFNKGLNRCQTTKLFAVESCPLIVDISRNQ